jgi:hypothetical protein
MRHFEQQLEQLQQRLLAMAALVEAAVDSSIRAVTERMPAEAEQGAAQRNIYQPV